MYCNYWNRIINNNWMNITINCYPLLITTFYSRILIIIWTFRTFCLFFLPLNCFEFQSSLANFYALIFNHLDLNFDSNFVFVRFNCHWLRISNNLNWESEWRCGRVESPPWCDYECWQTNSMFRTFLFSVNLTEKIFMIIFN